MEEQLISFETAKLAKKKGFDIFSIFWYDENPLKRKMQAYGSSYATEDTNTTYSVEYPGDEGMNDYIKEDNKELIYSAPTQALLAKWLREVHNIVIIIDFSLSNFYNNNKKSYFVDIYCLNINLGDRIKSKKVGYESPEKDHKLFDTYELAMESGLYESLKLINNESKTS